MNRTLDTLGLLYMMLSEVGEVHERVLMHPRIQVIAYFDLIIRSRCATVVARKVEHWTIVLKVESSIPSGSWLSLSLLYILARFLTPLRSRSLAISGSSATIWIFKMLLAQAY